MINVSVLPGKGQKKNKLYSFMRYFGSVSAFLLQLGLRVYVSFSTNQNAKK